MAWRSGRLNLLQCPPIRKHSGPIRRLQGGRPRIRRHRRPLRRARRHLRARRSCLRRRPRHRPSPPLPLLLPRRARPRRVGWEGRVRPPCRAPRIGAARRASWPGQNVRPVSHPAPARTASGSRSSRIDRAAPGSAQGTLPAHRGRCSGDRDGRPPDGISRSPAGRIGDNRRLPGLPRPAPRRRPHSPWRSSGAPQKWRHERRLASGPAPPSSQPRSPPPVPHVWQWHSMPWLRPVGPALKFGRTTRPAGAWVPARTAGRTVPGLHRPQTWPPPTAIAP